MNVKLVGQELKEAIEFYIKENYDSFKNSEIDLYKAGFEDGECFVEVMIFDNHEESDVDDE